MKLLRLLAVLIACCFRDGSGLPLNLLYDFDVYQSEHLPQANDVSQEVKLRVPVIFFGNTYETVYVNSNGFLSFQTEIPLFLNIEFPLDYPIIAPFYSNVDTTKTGIIAFYETDAPALLQRASNNVQDSFSNSPDFQATSLFIATWNKVGYFKEGEDKVNTYQVVVITDGIDTFVEFLYPESGIQWIQGTGDESGLPDARAQAGIISPDGTVYALPGSGTEQVKNLERWSNMQLNGQFIFKADGPILEEPDLHNDNLEKNANPLTCEEAQTPCHVQARCINYEEGFCCQCNENYYGNGKFCIKKDLPLRVTGKVNGKINGELLDSLDLQSYIVMNDGRAYTAISKIPDSVGYDIQSLQILGGVIGYLFAKPLRGAKNGYQLTGGIFNHTATLTFLNTSQVIRIKQKYLGLDVFDQVRLEVDIQGEIPTLPDESRVTVDEYQEDYTMTKPGVLQMTATRNFRYINVLNNEDVVHYYTIDQSFVFDHCRFDNNTSSETWKLKVGKNFINYEGREQIIRFGLSNKVTPFGDSDPCDEGRSKCGPNSSCVVDNDSYRCACNPGYQQFYTGNETTCADIDECTSGQHDCDYNAQCFNIVGGYVCRCNPGFEGTGQYCENARSCAGVQCTENAECVEENQVAQCRCLPGFRGDGQDCTPVVDHSCHVANNCSPYGVCTISPETNQYFCQCLPNYQGDGYICEPIPPPTNDPNSEYETTTTYYHREIQRCLLGVCWCPEGYTIEQGSKYCLSPEEQGSRVESLENADNDDNTPEVQCFNETLCFCPKGFIYNAIEKNCNIKPGVKFDTMGSSGIQTTCNTLNNCHPNAHCVYIQSTNTYSCQCKEGFEGDGVTFCDEEIISCTQLDNCDSHATCTYIDQLGKSRCVCNQGYEGDGLTCSLLAHCRSNEDCTSTEECKISQITQQYECICRDNYRRDSQHQCVPTGLCGHAKCVDAAECLFDDELQAYYCSCIAGYQGDGVNECKPKPVGCDVLNNCGANAKCQYDHQLQTYQCSCEEGFHGDGFVCYKERTCQVDPAMCHPQASCLADASRNFVCKCNPGYIGNGTNCKEVSKYEGNFLLLNQGMATLKLSTDPAVPHVIKRPLQTKIQQTSVGLDVDCLEGRFYWSDITGRAIRSANFEGKDKQEFIKDAIGSPEGLAIDWVSRNIYWTDSTNDTIEVANLDTKRRRTLFDTDLVNPRGIVVHPQRGKIFWTDWNRRNPKIEWANADGTDRQIFLQGQEVLLPNALAIDYETENLCYTDAGTKKIECVHIDSKVRKTVATNCSYPFGIAISENIVYWSDWISKKIERADKYSFNRLPPIKVQSFGSGIKFYGLVAVPNKCPQLSNYCQSYINPCPDEHICLPNGYSGKSCLCAYRSDKLDERPNCNL